MCVVYGSPVIRARNTFPPRYTPGIKFPGVFFGGMLTASLSLFSRFALNRLRERMVRAEHKNARTGNEMPVSIHRQYYLGECPATRYYRGLERRADFIMVLGEREPSNGMWNGRLVGWLVGRLLAWLASWLASWLAWAVEAECGEHPPVRADSRVCYV